MKDTLLAFAPGCMIMLILNSCQSSMNNLQHPDIREDSLLNLIQYRTFQYFLNGAEHNSGMARERFHMDERDHDVLVVTTGGSGFGVMSLVVGMERWFISRDSGINRIDTITIRVTLPGRSRDYVVLNYCRVGTFSLSKINSAKGLAS